MVDIVRVHRNTTTANGPSTLPEGQLAVNTTTRQIWIGTSGSPALIFDNGDFTHGHAHADLSGIGVDDHHPQVHAYSSHTGIPATFPPEAHTHTHASTTGQGTDDHHAKSHAHNGADGSGTVAYNDLTGKPSIPAAQTYLHEDLTDVGIDQHHAKSHAHDGIDGSGSVDYTDLTNKPTIPAAQTFLHSDLTDVSADQHHAKIHAWDGADHSGMPSTFPPATHTHVHADTTSRDAVNAHPIGAIGISGGVQLQTTLDSMDSDISNLTTDKVAKAGDTMTGSLILNADATAALGATTKQQMEANFTDRYGGLLDTGYLYEYSSTGNLNNVILNSIYSTPALNTISNLPPEADSNKAGIVESIFYSATNAIQKYTEINNSSTRQWLRQYVGSTWLAWVEYQLASEDWADVTLTNTDSWVSDATDKIQYRKTTDGMVEIRGTMTTGTVASTAQAFTVPAGYRPLANISFICACQGVDTVTVQVRVGGDFRPRYTSSQANAANGTYLQTIRYPAEN